MNCPYDSPNASQRTSTPDGSNCWREPAIRCLVTCGRRRSVRGSTVALALVGMALWLGACRGTADNVEQTVRQAAEAAKTGLSAGDLSAVEEYFATQSEGANADGLSLTIGALRNAASQLPSGAEVQFHSVDVQSVEVHDERGVARATYRVHFSLLRANILVYGAVVTGDLALMKTPRGWRISGGDAPQMSEAKGIWPPP